MSKYAEKHCPAARSAVSAAMLSLPGPTVNLGLICSGTYRDVDENPYTIASIELLLLYSRRVSTCPPNPSLELGTHRDGHAEEAPRLGANRRERCTRGNRRVQTTSPAQLLPAERGCERQRAHIGGRWWWQENKSRKFPGLARASGSA